MQQLLEKLGARSEVYKLLSHAYYAPSRDFPEADYPDRLRTALASVGCDPFATELHNLRSYLQSCREPLELAQEYTRLFRGPVKAQAYPYESLYVDKEVLGKSALDVMRRYGEAGVSVAGDFKDLPDHISAELEFMHYLYGKELDALRSGDGEEAARFQLMAHSFLHEHLRRWVPPFVDCVLQHATSPFYLSLARITKEFVSLEATRGGGLSAV